MAQELSTVREGVVYRVTERILITSGKNHGKVFYRLTDEEGHKFLAMVKPGQLNRAKLHHAN